MLIRLGLTGLALCTILLLLTATQLQGEFQREATYGLFVSAGLVGLGIVLRVLGAASRAVPLAHCGKCGRTVRKGQIYCSDHLREEVHAGEDAHRLMHNRN